MNLFLFRKKPILRELMQERRKETIELAFDSSNPFSALLW